jgi:hypothetical protein
MRIAILVHGPDFACSENLTRAFSLWGETRLVSLRESDWRGYDPGLVASEATMPEVRAVVDAADVLVLGDATALWALGRVSPVADWVKWARTKKVVAFFGDSAYHNHHQFYDGLCVEVGVRRLFLLPNLVPLTALDAVPLHHPMPAAEHRKAERLTVMHAPGRDGKAVAKGTAEIERAVERLQEELDFDYQRLMHLTLAECLAVKGAAHVVVDQVPPPGAIHGLGRSGLEALAAGSAVASRMYDAGLVRGFFDPPPVVNVKNGEHLEHKLRRLLEDGTLREDLMRRSLEWARQNVELEPWLSYVARYI